MIKTDVLKTLILKVKKFVSRSVFVELQLTQTTLNFQTSSYNLKIRGLVEKLFVVFLLFFILKETLLNLKRAWSPIDKIDFAQSTWTSFQNPLLLYNAWKMSKYGAFSVNLRIQSECRKKRTWKNSMLGTFDAVIGLNTNDSGSFNVELNSTFFSLKAIFA